MGLFDTTEEAKRKVLAIGAQTGEQGVQAFQQAQQDLEASRMQALYGLAESAGTIGAGGSATTALQGAVTPSFELLKSSLGNAQANYKTALDVNQAATLGALTHLGSLEPLLAAKAAEALARSGGGGGGGGGGSGGGGGGGGTDLAKLSDARLQTYALGAAQALRSQDRDTALRNLQAAAAQRAQTSAQRAALRRQIIQTAGPRLAQRVLARAPGRVSGTGINRRIAALQQRRTQLLRQHQGKGPRGRSTPHIDTELQRLRQTRTLIGERGQLAQTAAGQQGRLREFYGQARATYGEELTPLVQQWLVEQGIDPERALGLLTPTEQKSLRIADRDELKQAGGPLGAFGGVPLLAPKHIAKEVGVKPAKVSMMRNSPNYKTLARAAEEALAKGTDLQTFARDVAQSWSDPYWEKVSNPSTAVGAGPVRRKGDQQVQKVNGQVRVIARRRPGHSQLVKLILADYRPAFGVGYDVTTPSLGPDVEAQYRG